MNLHENENQALTVQVVMDILENLVPIERIITLAYYVDSMDVKHLSEMLQISLTNVKFELGNANEYIYAKCLEYELENNCRLSDVNEHIINEAFIKLFTQDKYLIRTGN